MTIHETETIECKRTVTSEITKEIIAFANTQGGTLYVGVEDDGTVLGVENADATALAMSNMVRDAIKPDVTMFLRYETQRIKGKDIVAVTVQRGTARPYYLAKKGLRPEGVYVRQGYSSVPATDAAIRQMIKETDGDHFEDMRALEQALTFDAASQEFAAMQLPFGDSQMRTLGLIGTDGLYTNLALLLSDQCRHTIKVAVFTDTTQNVFKDRREFSGSLFTQLNAVYAYLDIYNQTYADFEGLRRTDRRDYPLMALREALLNAIVHREYAIHASTLISVYTDRIECTSIGGLAPNMTIEDVYMGVSVCRNPKLANIFYRLEFIEAYGTGIRKIQNAYHESGLTPIIETSPNAFKLTLPNLNAHRTTNTISEAASPYHSIADEETQVLAEITTYGATTRRSVEALLGLSQSAAGRLLKRLCNEGKIISQGDGKNVRYILPQ